jgi:deoxycytidine triphosphate deaminase
MEKTMSLLRDEELIAAITVQPPTARYVEGAVLPADPYSRDSPVQASSIDLHIGNVYLPGEKESDLGGAQNPKDDYSLKTGETAVVTTAETLHLPSDVAGFGFPPSGVSFKGLLMTNPGHVDPGYEGVMRFTVINMGKDPYCLERGGRVVTLLLFRLAREVHTNWRQRNPAGSRLPNHAEISRLSRDFVDVKNRAENIAEDIAKKRGMQWSAGIAAAATLILGLLQLTSSGRLFSRADVEDLKKRQDIVEYDVKNRVDVDKKLQEFDNRLKELERSSKSAEPSQKGAVVKPTPKVSGNQ